MKEKNYYIEIENYIKRNEVRTGAAGDDHDSGLYRRDTGNSASGRRWTDLIENF